jgi:7-carboxy-7-deazaguanine synthase
MDYPLAREGVFRAVQGEGILLGVPMVFIRLAGCPIACAQCDTDYAVARRAQVSDVIQEALLLRRNHLWAWITGGEPALYNLRPLVAGLRHVGFAVAVATSGHYEAGWGEDFLSVSPHDPAQWKVRRGGELKLVAGLGTSRLADFEPTLQDPRLYWGACYVLPCAGKPETLPECLAWVEHHRGWRLGIQAQKTWGLA